MNEAAPHKGAAAPLSQDDYNAQLHGLSSALRLAHDLVAPVELEQLGRLVDRADAFGPIIDPAAWRSATTRGQLELQRALFRWAAETIRAFHECRRIHEGRPASKEIGPRGRRSGP